MVFTSVIQGFLICVTAALRHTAALDFGHFVRGKLAIVSSFPSTTSECLSLI